MDAISKKRPQPKKELMKLVKDEIQLRSPKFNAAVFIDLVKERVCDWIIMHNFRPAKKERISITRMTFEPGWEMQAIAEYHVSSWKQYSFYTYYNFDKEQYLTTVIDPYVFANSGVVTRGWDGITNLLFDSKGYSYEVTREEKKIIDSYQRFKHPQLNDRLYVCKKCGTNFAANDLDIWLDNGLFCPVCKSKDIEFLVTENV